MFHYPITLSILALQLPLTSMTASHNLCHHLNTVYNNTLHNIYFLEQVAINSDIGLLCKC
ncbi:BJ4_G0053880.mRNA.1.CDS.1 [Saccharomyces cerevisiae]|nr:BJ4_G0053880.mRNA.1.CDS.1 [Saccharomyces cerevisiae]